MNKKVLILHGLGGSDYPHWQNQLAMDLIKDNYEVSFPQLPNRDNPNKEQWISTVKKHLEDFKPNIVVCHSLANIVWFHLCEDLNFQLDKLLLVAPVSNTCTIPEISSFFPYPIPKDLKSKEAMMACSNNDKYISLQEAIKLQSTLNVGMKIMENAGHINPDSGFGKLDCALDWIKRVLE